MRYLNYDNEKFKRIIDADKSTMVFSVMGNTFLWDSNSMKLFTLQSQRESSLYVPDDTIPDVFNYPPSAKAIPAITLNVTYKCPTACLYCFVKNYGCNEGQDMTFETAIKAIHMLTPENAVPNVGFFGGEPLMNFPLIEKVVLYVEKLYAELEAKYVDNISKISDEGKKAEMKLWHSIYCQKPTFNLTTCGTPIIENHRIADFLFSGKHNFNFIVSLDGAEELHNKYRPGKDGRNSFQGAMEFLKEAKRLGFKGHIALRGTFTREDIQLVKRVEFLNNLVKGGYAQSVSVEPMVLGENTEGGYLSFRKDDINELAKEYIELSNWVVDRLNNDLPAWFYHFQVPGSRIWYRTPYITECGAGKIGGYFTIEPNGDIAACHRTAHSNIGNITYGIDLKKSECWQDNTITNKERCSRCIWRFVCGGGCRATAIDCGYPITGTNPVMCSIEYAKIYACVNLINQLTPKQCIHYFGKKERRNL